VTIKRVELRLSGDGYVYFLLQTLLNTGIKVLEEEIALLRDEEQTRKEMKERERLAPLAAREKALKNIEDDRRRVKEREKRLARLVA